MNARKVKVQHRHKAPLTYREAYIKVPFTLKRLNFLKKKSMRAQ